MMNETQILDSRFNKTEVGRPERNRTNSTEVAKDLKDPKDLKNPKDVKDTNEPSRPPGVGRVGPEHDQ